MPLENLVPLTVIGSAMGFLLWYYTVDPMIVVGLGACLVVLGLLVLCRVTGIRVEHEEEFP